MATNAMLKRRKAAANKAVGKTKAGPRRKRGPTETFEAATPTHAPYDWDNDDAEAPAVNGRKSMTTRAEAIENHTDTSGTESYDDDEDTMEVK